MEDLRFRARISSRTEADSADMSMASLKAPESTTRSIAHTNSATKEPLVTVDWSCDGRWSTSPSHLPTHSWSGVRQRILCARLAGDVDARRFRFLKSAEDS